VVAAPRTQRWRAGLQPRRPTVIACDSPAVARRARPRSAPTPQAFLGSTGISWTTAERARRGPRGRRLHAEKTSRRRTGVGHLPARIPLLDEPACRARDELPEAASRHWSDSCN